MANNIDIDTFLERVEDALHAFQSGRHTAQWPVARYKTSAKAPAKKRAAAKKSARRTPPALSKKLEREATTVLKSRKVRNLLCPVLRRISSDAFDVAKIITPILMTLSFSHTISLPFDPTVYAAIALVITRTGVAALCGDAEKKT